jgi:hypothetical protein
MSTDELVSWQCCMLGAVLCCQRPPHGAAVSLTRPQTAFELGPDLASNTNGSYLQLMGAPWIEPVPFKLPGPFARQTKALVAAKCGPKYPIASVDIVATGSCDACAKGAC